MAKRYFLYIAAILFITACSSEKEITEDLSQYNDGVYARIVSDKLSGETESRSSLAFDFEAKEMKFNWDSDDKISVFAELPGSESTSQNQEFVIDPEAEIKSPLVRKFKAGAGVRALEGNTSYIAFRPYVDKPLGYNSISVSYENQQQAENVDMTYCPLSVRTKDADWMTAFNTINPETEKTPREEYFESEAKASAHLANYDFSASVPTTTKENGAVFFSLNRLGTIIRLNIKVDDDIVYDSLQIVNKDAWFTTKANLDLSDISNPFTPTLKRHVISLGLNEKGNPGMDFSDKSDITKWCDYTGKGDIAGFIIAYLMVVPIDLKQDKIEQSTLYLCGHVKDTDVKKYYKATLGTKPTLKPNTYFQWSPAAGPDEPITFTAIEVEEWKEKTGIDNGSTTGTGTQTW